MANIVSCRYRHELRHLSFPDRLGLLPRRVKMRRETLQRNRLALYRMLEARARQMRRRLAAAEEPLSKFPSRVDALRRKLGGTAATLEAVSPLSVLWRGYAIAFSRMKNRRKPILDSAKVNVGDPIDVQLKKGRLNCTVD